MLKCDLNMNLLLNIVDFCGFLFSLNFSTQTHPTCFQVEVLVDA